MVKRLKIESVCNFVTVIPLLLILGLANGDEIWKLPTALDIQMSLENCQAKNLSFLSSEETNNNNTSIRCFATFLNLWTDEEGFITKRFVKLLNKHQQPVEISIVIDYCNSQHKQLNLNKWAEEAYYCFAKGRIGKWLSEYIKNVFRKNTILNA